MKCTRIVIQVCLALFLAACGGGQLSVDLPKGKQTLDLLFPPGQAVEHRLPRISGGIPPYESSIDGCPDWVTLFPDQGILAGTGPAADSGQTFFCTFQVTESDPGFRPARTVSYGLRLVVTAPETPPLEFTQRFEEITFQIGTRYQIEFPAASGGVAPYTYELVDCALPAGLEFHSNTRFLSGTPNAVYRGPNCTYRVTDNSSPPVSVSWSFVLIVDPLDRGKWRFRTRSLPQSDHPLNRTTELRQRFATLPHAIGESGTPTYRLPDVRLPLRFDQARRELSYTHTGVDPLFDTPITFRYEVWRGNADKADDALCVDVSYRDPPPREELPNDGLLSTVRVSVRDDVYWDGEEYRCPDAPPESAMTAHATLSNPVHEALGPVHARRAAAVASAAVRDRVRGWSPGSEQASFALTPEVGFASLSGQHDGFDYTGNSESATVGAETGAGAWQAGLVASFTRTELRYQAEAALAELGYRTGEHDTEILSLHPFAAWHLPSGGHLWAVLGGGTGDLRHRDDLGFPSWSNSDVRLLAYAAGTSVPLAEMLSGELQAEAGIDSFAFDIKGGGRISSSLPTMRGVDYRAGLGWSAPVRGSPSVSLAYRHATGDGPEGGLLEARGSVSVEGILHPRLALIGNAEGSVGLGDYEQDFWRLGGGVRFAPDSLGRGFGLELNTRFASLGDGAASGVGIRGEVGYGLWGGPFFRTMRPYVGLVRYSDGDSVRRTLGLDLGHASNWPIKIEVLDRSDDQSLRFSLRHRF